MPSEETPYQYNERCWLTYQFRIINGIYSSPNQKESYLDYQEYHLQRMMLLQPTIEILHELGVTEAPGDPPQ